MLVIGIDSHKSTLSVCLVDHLGTALEYRSIANTPAGHRHLVDWAQTTKAARVAVEGSGSYGRPIAVAAISAGLDVREVPPQLTARLRRRGRTQTKTDQVDALVIARVALRDHTLSVPTFWEDTEDLRVLVTYRRELVEDRTAQANWLHADLEKIRPGYHQIIPRFTTRKALDQAMKLCWRDTTCHGRVAKQRIRKTATTRHPDQRTHRRDQNHGRPVRNPPTRHSRRGCASRSHHPRRSRQPLPLSH